MVPVDGRSSVLAPAASSLPSFSMLAMEESSLPGPVPGPPSGCASSGAGRPGVQPVGVPSVFPFRKRRTAPVLRSAGQEPFPWCVRGDLNSEGDRPRGYEWVRPGPLLKGESDGLSPRRFAEIRRRPAGLVTNPVTNPAILVGLSGRMPRDGAGR
jgi:hypothetical protein